MAYSVDRDLPFLKTVAVVLRSCKGLRFNEISAIVEIMEVRGSSSAALFELLGHMRRVWVKGGWSWDSRFSCVASSFNVEMEREALAVVTQFFVSEWTGKNIQSAPTPIREIAEGTGGIRPDQRLFTGDTSGRLVAFGLWWPWGDEITVSLRVGLGGYVRENDLVRLREVFGTVD